MLVRENFDKEEIDVAKLQNMIGMNVTWNYSENIVSAVPSYLNENENKNFRKVANVFNKYGFESDLWSEIKKFKIEFVLAVLNNQTETDELHKKIKTFLDNIEDMETLETKNLQ